MFEFHADRERYFEIQVMNARDYVIPFIEERYTIPTNARVLEIGSGEGGVLKAFIEKGCTGVGVELDLPRVENAKKFLATELEKGLVHFVDKDIYKVDTDAELKGRFDIIILKDVIEHIHDQTKLITWMKQLLNPGGVIFFGFPPWQMPFGGHQQICKSTISKLPYIHLLPRPIYRWILTKNNEPVADLMEIRDTQISIERFESICNNENYKILHKRHYLLNPIYQWKFGWKPIRQSAIISALPWFRNFVTTCVYYLIQSK
jgi:SAM-dependent methyltransferase